MRSSRTSEPALEKSERGNKIEIRNTKSETISNFQKLNVRKGSRRSATAFWSFEYLNFGFVSSFDIRISDFVLRISIFMLVALLILSASTLLSCTSTSQPEPISIEAAPVADEIPSPSEGPPPLIVDMETPLLLDDPAEGENATVTNTETAAENSACFVCHANYRGESLAGSHAGVNIGCVDCHGQSMAHRNDENNTTPPEIMYAARKIDPFCQGCHTSHDIPARTVVARWKERGLDKAKADPAKLVCTDCHGDHRMRIRTIIWDKATGTLLRTNQGQKVN
ncbi:MAG: hypothetical protein A2Z25_21835 [Planctomycetes bacterium RBG_16_55_9]|nr:MAG: hypothetical protein A2Z25_21835 [Planctomycetes bacterium RBG_16_55_9]